MTLSIGLLRAVLRVSASPRRKFPSVTSLLVILALLPGLCYSETPDLQKHRDLASQAVKDKKFDVAQRERLAEYLEALKSPSDKKQTAMALAEWGDSYFYERKNRDAEALYRKAIALYEATQADSTVIDPVLVRLSMALAQLSRIDYNRPLEMRLDILREAMGKLAKARNPSAKTAGSQLNSLGVGLLYKGYYSSAELVLRRSVAVEETPFALTNLADVERVMGRLGDAEQHLNKALTLEASENGSAGQSGSSIAQHRLYFLGMLNQAQGQYDVAKAVLEQSIEAGGFKPWHADAHRVIANGYRDRGQYAQADAFYQRALELDRANYPNLDSRYRAECLDDMGLAALKQHDLAKAEADWDEALAILKKILRPEHPGIALVMWHQALLLNERNKPSEAAQLAGRALAWMEQAMEPGAPALVPLIKDCAKFQETAGHVPLAMSLRARAAAILNVPAPPIAKSQQLAAVELESGYWSSIEGRKEPALFHQYLRDFPMGRYAAKASEIAKASPEAAVHPPENPPCAQTFEAVPVENFAACFNTWSKAGFAPAALAIYQQNGSSVLMGSFLPMQARLLTVLLTENDQRDAIDLYAARHYRPDIVTVLMTPNGPRFTTTWAPARLAFGTVFAPSAAALRTDLDSQSAKHQVSTVILPMDAKGQRYFSTWTDVGSWPEATAYFDLSHYDSTQLFTARRAAGFAPFRRWDYVTADGAREAQVWFKPKRPLAWYWFRGLNRARFETTRSELEARGYSLVHLDALTGEISAVWWRADDDFNTSTFDYYEQ